MDVVPATAGSALVLRGQRSRLVPVAAEHVAQLRRIRADPAVRRYWRDVDASSGWPLDEPSVTRFAVLVDGEVRGLVQYAEEDDEDYRHASLDIFLDPAVHGRGVGRDAVATLARYLVDERRHHRLVIDPAADNTAAIHCYASIGFRPVGVMRRYERDTQGGGWHDGLLMDLLAEELPRASAHRERPGPAAPAQPTSAGVTAALATHPAAGTTG